MEKIKFNRPYVIDIVYLPTKWKEYFYDQYRESEYHNNSYIDLYWNEFGNYEPKQIFDEDGEINEYYEDELIRYNLEKEFRELCVASGIPDDAENVVLYYWW